MVDQMTRRMSFAVTVRVDGQYLFHGAQPIIHTTDKRVWVEVSYANEYPQDLFTTVTDGIEPSGYDDDGNKIISVPIEYCTFYTAEEYDMICRCIDADERLLGYAS